MSSSLQETRPGIFGRLGPKPKGGTGAAGVGGTPLSRSQGVTNLSLDTEEEASEASSVSEEIPVSRCSIIVDIMDMTWTPAPQARPPPPLLLDLVLQLCVAGAVAALLRGAGPHPGQDPRPAHGHLLTRPRPRPRPGLYSVHLSCAPQQPQTHRVTHSHAIILQINKRSYLLRMLYFFIRKKLQSHY